MSIAKRLQTIEQKCELVSQTNIIFKTRFEFLVIESDRQQPYKPLPTGIRFHSSNDFVRLVMGAYGSGKSTMCCAEVVRRACEMPQCNDGVRRSRWAFVRNTYGDLEGTTLKTWLEWFGHLGLVKGKQSPRMVYSHHFNDGKGKIELEIVFIALDRPDQVRKLKSLELTGVFLNELCEIPQAVLTHFKARVNRYPAQRDCQHEFWSGIIADTNPPPTDHWLYKMFEVDKPDGHEIFHQPPAVLKAEKGYIKNPAAENLEHLKGGIDYYFMMMSGQTQEFIKVYVMGKYGVVVDGKPIYPQYNDDLHSIDEIEIDRDLPIILGWDYGTVSPACLLAQYDDKKDQLKIVKEFVCEYMTVKELYENSVKVYLSRECKGMDLETAIGDPADTYDGIAQLEECGLFVEKAETNKVDQRINAVSEFLNKLVSGKPKIIISRAGCPKLREGFAGKYAYKRLRIVGEERYNDVPFKNHPFSDIHDCLQYICLYFGHEFKRKEVIYDYKDYAKDDTRSPVTGY